MGNIDSVEGRPTFRYNDLYLVKSGVRSMIGEYQLFKNVATNQLYMSIPKPDTQADYSLRCLFTNPNLLQTVGYGFGWKELIGVENPKQQLFFEYCEHTLHDIIQNKIQDQTHFLEEELVTIARDICGALTFLREHDVYHGHLTTSSVFYDYRVNKYKLYDHSLILGTKTALSINSDKHLAYYSSPELLLEAKSQRMVTGSSLLKGIKNDIYSLGMILLEAATLYSSKDCYDLSDLSIYLSIIEDRFQSLKIRYSARFIEILRSLLQYDASKRADLLPLSNSLASHDHEPSQFIGSSSKKQTISWLTDEESSLGGSRIRGNDKASENRSPLSRTKVNHSSSYYSSSGNKCEIIVPDNKFQSVQVFKKETKHVSLSPSREYDYFSQGRRRSPLKAEKGLPSLDFFRDKKYFSPERGALEYKQNDIPFLNSNQIYVDKFSNDGVFEEMSRKYQAGNTSQSWISDVSVASHSHSIYRTPQANRTYKQSIDLENNSLNRLNRFVQRGPPPNVFSIGRTSPRSLAELQQTMISMPMNLVPSSGGSQLIYRIC